MRECWLPASAVLSFLWTVLPNECSAILLSAQKNDLRLREGELDAQGHRQINGREGTELRCASVPKQQVPSSLPQPPAR